MTQVRVWQAGGNLPDRAQLQPAYHKRQFTSWTILGILERVRNTKTGVKLGST